jgi:hypothetical protein
MMMMMKKKMRSINIARTVAEKQNSLTISVAHVGTDSPVHRVPKFANFFSFIFSHV